MNQVKVILSQLKELYLRMNSSQRLSIVMFGGSLFLFLLVWIMWATKSEEQDRVLFWSVGKHQAAEIAEKLTTMGVEHRYHHHTGAFTVGTGADTSKVMMALAQEGLLPEDLSYDFARLVEESAFTLTKDERERNYDMALNNELAKMLKEMDFVSDADVTISLLEESPLLKRHIKRTAAVKIKVKGNRALTKNEVEGIARLVSSAVKGLMPEEVSITDTRGRPYTYSDEMDARDKFEIRKKLELDYKRKVEDHLLQWIPKVIATVSIDVDISKKRKEVKDYNHKDLNKGAFSVLQRNEQEKESSVSKEGSQGVVGAGTNTEAEIKRGDGGTQMTANKSRKVENFDSSLVQEHIEYDPANDRINGVAVTVVNMKYNPKFSVLEGRSKENLEYEEYDWMKEGERGNPTLNEVVAKILGIDPKQVEVTQQSMMLDFTPNPPSWFARFVRSTPWTLVSMLALALVAAFILMGMIKRAQPEEEILEMPQFEEEAQEELEPLEEPELDPKFRQIENRVKEIIEDDPAKATGLIRHWLSSD